MPAMIYTIGHGRSGFAEVAAVLEQHGVATIIDVRSQPFSQPRPRVLPS